MKPNYISKLRIIFYELTIETRDKESLNLIRYYQDTLADKGLTECFCQLLLGIISNEKVKEDLCKEIAKRLNNN